VTHYESGCWRDSKMGDVVEFFFWRLARAAPCCPAACKSMKTW
jgi:hypothetical protein